MQQAVKKALSLVGQGYIYGAKGQICSRAFREQQAQQYPDQADNILKTGEKWDGMPVWDCAQLTRAAAAADGVSLVSGATSQWTKTEWKAKGSIDTLPEGEAVFLYRMSGGRMQHTGIALGDGTCVHARGTAYGVVRQQMAEYAWTHWASLREVPSVQLLVTGTAEVWAPSGSTVNVRSQPGGRVIGRLKIGTVVEVCAHSAGWTTIVYQGETASMQSAFLRTASVEQRLETLIQKINALENRLEKAGL